MAYKLKSSIDSLCGSPVRAIDPMYNGKKGVQQGDFEQFSSAAKMNAEKGTNPIYNLSGKKGLQPSNNPAAAYMTGSPVNNLGHGRKGPHIHLGSTSDDSVSSSGKIFQNFMRSAGFKKYGETSTSNVPDATNNNFVPNTIGQGSETYNSETPNIGVKSNDGGATPAVKPIKVKTPEKRKPVEEPVVRSSNSNQPPPLTQGDAAKLRDIKANENKNSPPPEALTGGDAVRLAKIKEKKKGKEMSRGEIREAKKKDKDSGMSRKEVRANKLKRKAASAKAKGIKIVSSIDTTKPESSATKAKQTKAGYKRTKSIRLQKKVARLKGRQEASKIK